MESSYILFFVLGAAAVVLIRLFLLEQRGDRIPVLIYHRIVADDRLSLCRKSSYVVSESMFRQHMEFLRRNGFTPIDLDDFLYYRGHKNELPAKPVILTFDDGYENNYRYAFPILKSLGFKAVIYSVADPAAPFFSSFEFPERLLSPEQMRELSDSGISIQGHTTTHPMLKYLSDENIRQELEGCKKTLEAITGRPVTHMAIPYGSWDRRVPVIAREAGYKTLAVPGKGTINLDTDPLRLNRLSIHQDTGAKEFGQIAGSPLYAVLNRMYAAAHLSIRYTLGQGFERRIKKLFARFGFDNPKKFSALALAAAVLALGMWLLVF